MSHPSAASTPLATGRSAARPSSANWTSTVRPAGRAAQRVHRGWTRLAARIGREQISKRLAHFQRVFQVVVGEPLVGRQEGVIDEPGLQAGGVFKLVFGRAQIRRINGRTAPARGLPGALLLATDSGLGLLWASVLVITTPLLYLVRWLFARTHPLCLLVCHN